MNFLYKKFIELIKIYYPTKEYKRYIIFNQKKWKKIDRIAKPFNEGEILIDLFHHYPFINIWSNLTNQILKRKNYKIRYFYFYFYKGYFNKFKFFSHKLIEIYKSFNVDKDGLDERDIKFRSNNKNLINLEKIMYNKNKLQNFKYRGIKIGDLVYDTYLRTKRKPTINLKDNYLKKLLFRSINIFDYLIVYLKKNNVKIIIVSHPYYIQYGILTRIAIKLKIPVIMVYSKNRGNDLFRLKLIDNKHPVEDFKYYNYKRIFSKLNKKKEKISIGKKIIKNRFSGKFLDQLPYMKKNLYTKSYLLKKQKNQNRNNVYVFAHDFFDAPHRFRWMIFEDFFEQLKYLEYLASKTPHLNWFLKPHPNAIDQNYFVIKKIFSNSKYLNLIDKNIDNFEIIKKEPKFILTNHGTIAHEFAYHNIPVINTGDNLHINYNFCLHAKNKKDLKNFILNFEKYKNKINFNKKNIYEFIYMEYFHSKNKYNEFDLDKHKMWSAHIDNDKCLDFFINKNSKNKNYLDKYINKFLDDNLS